MSEKHYPYIGGSFDRIVFDGDGSVWVPEPENAKLRELVRRYSEYTSQDCCEGCVCKSRCNDGDVDECWQLMEIRVLARELGIEADI